MSDPETPDDEPSGTTESAEAPAAESPETSPSGDDTQSENETEATSEPGDEKTSKTSSGVPTGPASEQGAPKEPRIVVAEAIDPKHIDSDAKRVVARLRRAGFEAFLVGGCVRDLLLDKQPKDWDVITSAMPAEIRKVFSNSRIVGRRFRLVHVLFSSKVIEVSTFRAASTPGTLAEAKALQEAQKAAWKDDLEDRDDDDDDEDRDDDETEGQDDQDDKDDKGSKGRRGRGRRDKRGDKRSDKRRGSKRRRTGPIAEDSDPSLYGDARSDAWRRDFSINALFLDPRSREILDYVGGLKDIESRIVRSINESDEAMNEDPVRVLRAIRFAAKLNFQIESTTLASVKKHASELARCSQRRIFEEILKILNGGYAALTMRRLMENDVLASLMPEIAAWIGDDTAEPEVRLDEPPVVDDENEGPQDRPIVFTETEAAMRELVRRPARGWEPAPFMIDAFVHVSWSRPPQEGSNEWNEDPEQDISDDVFEAAAFQRDIVNRRRKGVETGLSAERRRARAALLVLRENNLIEERIGDFVIDNLESGRTRNLVEILRANSDLPPIASRKDRLLRYMRGLDLLRGSGMILTPTTVISALFSAPVDELGDKKKLEDRLDEIMGPMVMRHTLSRKDRDHTRKLLMANQGQTPRPRVAKRRRKRARRQLASRRSLLNDAMLAKWLECYVNGGGWVDFLHWEETEYSPAMGTRPVTHRVSLGLEELCEI